MPSRRQMAIFLLGRTYVSALDLGRKRRCAPTMPRFVIATRYNAVTGPAREFFLGGGAIALGFLPQNLFHPPFLIR